MADKELNVRIKLKRDTDANWRAKDPQLLAGEVVFVDTNAGEVRTKVGDGTKKYSALPFSDEAVRNLISNSVKPPFYFTGTISSDQNFVPSKTVAELDQAVEDGRSCYCQFTPATGTMDKMLLPLVGYQKNGNIMFQASLDAQMAIILYQPAYDANTWFCQTIELAKKTDIPTKTSDLTNDSDFLTSTSASSTYVKKTGDETIKGIKTFESVIKDSAVPTDDAHLTNKKYVDDAIPTIPTSLRNPYALTVKGAVSATYDGSSAVSITIPEAGISQTDADARYLQLSGGTLSGDLDLGVKSIKNFKDLTFANTVAVEPALIRNDGDTQSRIYLKFSQGTNDAHITGIASPLADTDVANKSYVDSAISTANASYLPLSGGKMTGDVNFNNKSLTTVYKLGFTRGVYFQNSSNQQPNVLQVLTSANKPAYISAYASYPVDGNDSIDGEVIVPRAYVDTKATVVLKTWTSDDVS